MNHHYNGLLKSLEPVLDLLIQVNIYEDLSGKQMAVVILDKDPDNLQDFVPMAKYIHKNKLALPLVINRRFIKSSLDSYPLEFIDIMSSQHVNLLLKEDILSKLEFLPSDVRLQMEREFKSKWLLTRQMLLDGNLSPRKLKETLPLSISALIPALKGFFFLAKQPYPLTSKELFDKAGLISKIDLSPLERWRGQSHYEIADAEHYLAILDKLTDLMETYPTT
nr:hypothetical protein [Candidatus Cloacimonadota bacterium]